jgi:drug/metabolite transporter (DMT)-like permease
MPAAAEDTRRALGAATIAVVVWGFGPLMVRGIDASASSIVFWRFVLAQPVMIGASYYFGNGLSWRLLRRSFLPGALFAVSMLAAFTSFQKTSIVNASLIQAMQPALLLVVAPFVFKKRTTARQFLFGGVSLVGVAVLVIGGGGTEGSALEGDLWALFNLVLWTVYFILVQRIRQDGEDATSILAAVFIASCVVATPLTLLTADGVDDVFGLGWKGWVLEVAMVLGPGLVGHGMMMWAQRHLDIRVSSLMGLASPVISTVGAWAIYSQSLSVLQVVGGAVVLAGLTGVMGDRVARATKTAR